jgi:uncharacterized membrane protein
MNDPIDKLKAQWQASKQSLSAEPGNVKDLISKAEKGLRGSMVAQIWNVFILSVTLIGIGLFFFWVAPLQQLLSRAGMAMMMGGLLARILIESYSIIKTSRLKISDAVLAFHVDAYRFYQYRKRIHGPLTITILLMYSLGFYMLLPEFAYHLGSKYALILGISYILAAAIFGFFIYKGIKNEMKDLQSLRALCESLEEQDKTDSYTGPGLSGGQ